MINPGSRLGPYEIVAPIGAGGMGEVYRARDTKLNRDIAIKVLPAALSLDLNRLTRFKREAQLLAALNHPNVAAIYGFEESSAVRALVLELVEGPTLAARIAKGRIPIDEALPIAKQIAEALEAAHEQGVVHRDLKPANIKLRPDGMVKVLDFGLAKALDASAVEQPFPPSDDVPGSHAPVGFGHDVTGSPTMLVRATHAGTILGTPAYMAPEQAKGQSVDRRADIWAFGVVLFEMLTGRKAYSGETPSETLAHVIEREVDFRALPASTPQAIVALLGRCLTKESRKRLQAIGEARLVIERALTETAWEPSPRYSPDVATRARWPVRRRLAWLVAAVAAIGSAALATWRPWRAPLQKPVSN